MTTSTTTPQAPETAGDPASASAAHQPSEPAFLLLKPDCLRSGLVEVVDRAVADAGLTVLCRHRVELTPSDVRFLWSEYNERDHVLATAFLDRYLCDGPSEVVMVSGPDAFEATRRIKRDVRGRHARGIFANVVHGSETRGELTRQATLLLGRCAHCTDRFGAQSPVTNPLRPPGLAFRERFDVDQVVEDLWPRLEKGLAPPDPFPLSASPEAEPTSAAYLGVDSDNSLDSAVTAVWHALPGVELGHALMLTLYAGRSGGHPIGVGTEKEAERCHATLIEYGIKNCWYGAFPASSR
ncbi:nucleoside-diphosphate kinase [Streptomyces sp. NBC_00441]|uniref:nucleoside-diphosphate kinase n=1 Tax=Streptomyces sp. NBC_00441 TaxID=2975742 RepID=UPI002E2C1D18|nr:nucleoside-diphosphate kinase [Streptomyces sp. NBC_00441]